MNRNRNIYYIIPLCVIILFFSYAGNETDGPDIKFETETYSFGKINEGEQVKYAFVFKNTGKEVLNITGVRPACGCTLAGAYDKEVSPGATGKIPVVLNTNGFEGEIIKTIRVSTNVPQKEEIVLTLKGSVYNAVTVQPKTVWLGQVASTAPSLSGFFTVTNNSKIPLKITKIIPPSDRVTAKSTTIKKNQEYQIEITVNPPFGSGSVNDTIIIETNNPDKKRLNIRFTYHVTEGISVNPQSIYIKPGTTDEEFERIVTVKNSFSEPVKIINPHFSGGNVSFLIQEVDPGKLYQIKLLFPRGFTLTGKEMLVFTFMVQSTKGTDVFNIAIKPTR